MAATQIERIVIKNFKGIESVELKNIGGRHVYLMGPNEAGKSSFIDAVWFALTGKNLADEPVNKDAKKGLIEIELTDYMVRVKLTRKKPVSFEIERKNAEPGEEMVKAPRTWLNDAIGVIDFDINTFFDKTGLEQVKYLCSVIGVDFSDLDESLSEVEQGRLLDGRELKALKPRWNFYDKELAAKEPVDVVQLSKDIADAKTKYDTFQRIQKGVDDRNARKLELEAELAKINSEIVDAAVWLNDADNVPLDNVAYDKMKTDLSNSTATNVTINEARDMAKLETDIERLEGKLEASQLAIDETRADKTKRLAEALKVDGLTYDVVNEQFLYNGLPFARNQINTASQIIAGLKIGATLLKDLKILKFDASLLDNKNLALVKQFADENKIELFVEMVDRSKDKLEVVVEES